MVNFDETENQLRSILLCNIYGWIDCLTAVDKLPERCRLDMVNHHE